MKQEFHVKQKFCLVNSYRNTISKWALGFRYRNFFIPRVEKNLKISPWEGNSNLPRAYGPWEDRVSSLGLIFGGFFNPWDEEISIPETRPIRKSYISRLTEVDSIANLLEVDSEEVKQALLTRVIAAGGQVCNYFYFMQESFH